MINPDFYLLFIYVFDLTFLNDFLTGQLIRLKSH